MCEGHRPRPPGFLANLFRPGLTLGERVRLVPANLARRLRPGGPHGCCGNYGEPGC